MPGGGALALDIYRNRLDICNIHTATRMDVKQDRCTSKFIQVFVITFVYNMIITVVIN